MIHYFVEEDGMLIEDEDQHRGYYKKADNPGMFLSYRAAIKYAKKQIKNRIKEMQEQLKEYEKEEIEIQNNLKKEKHGNL